MVPWCLHDSSGEGLDSVDATINFAGRSSKLFCSHPWGGKIYFCMAQPYEGGKQGEENASVKLKPWWDLMGSYDSFGKGKLRKKPSVFKPSCCQAAWSWSCDPVLFSSLAWTQGWLEARRGFWLALPWVTCAPMLRRAEEPQHAAAPWVCGAGLVQPDSALGYK